MVESLTLHENGISVQRNLCDKKLCESIKNEMDKGFDQLLKLPAAMSAANAKRHFIAIKTVREQPDAVKEEFYHQSQFKLPLSPSMETFLKAVLEGNAASNAETKKLPPAEILNDLLGDDAQLCGISVIRSEKGSEQQAWHGDSGWIRDKCTKMATVFFALHDVIDESLGPTRFIANTHKPSCFEDGKWFAPTKPIQREEREAFWVPLKAGDAVVMDSHTWHQGGANTSDQKRTLFSFTFCENGGGCEMPVEEGSVTLKELVGE